MLEKGKIIEQTRLAFDFIQKLYFEVSYMIKEIEGILEEEKFLIGRPAGYQISTRSSTGLESKYVNFWLPRKFAVFFVEEDFIKGRGGRTETPLDFKLKVLYLRYVLDMENLEEPKIYSGVLSEIKKKPHVKDTKFEFTMGYLQVNDNKIFRDPVNVNYEDKNYLIKGKFIENNLFEINDSDAIKTNIVTPCLDLYRKY